LSCAELLAECGYCYIILRVYPGGSDTRRLELIKQLVGKRSIILCIDETGDKLEEVPIISAKQSGNKKYNRCQ